MQRRKSPELWVLWVSMSCPHKSLREPGVMGRDGRKAGPLAIARALVSTHVTVYLRTKDEEGIERDAFLTDLLCASHTEPRVPLTLR